MFSVFAEEGRLAIVSTLLFAAAAFCARTARPAVKRYRPAAAAIAARMMFVIVHPVMGTTEPEPAELQLRLRPAGLALRAPGAPASIKLSRHPSSARRGMIRIGRY